MRVGDFGLAKDIYTSPYYRASAGARLPVKWMAPEALSDAISNEKTDVVCTIIKDYRIGVFQYLRLGPACTLTIEENLRKFT